MLNFSVTFFFSLLNIGILFLVLRAILFKPVTKFMAARQAKIQGDIDAAAKERADAKALHEQYQAELAKAGAEIEQMRAEGRAKAQKEADALVAEAKQQCRELVVRAEKQAAAEREAALLVFRAQAAALVIAVTKRLLLREVDAREAALQADAFLKELGNTPDFGHPVAKGKADV